MSDGRDVFRLRLNIARELQHKVSVFRPFQLKIGTPITPVLWKIHINFCLLRLLVFDLGLWEPGWDGRTGRQTDKSRNAAYLDGRIITKQNSKEKK